MHRIETILGGIALILFGIASMMIAEYTYWGLFELLAVVCPIIGIGFSIFGLLYNEKSSPSDE